MEEIAGLLDDSWTVEAARTVPADEYPDGVEVTIHDAALVATR